MVHRCRAAKINYCFQTAPASDVPPATPRTPTGVTWTSEPAAPAAATDAAPAATSDAAPAVATDAAFVPTAGAGEAVQVKIVQLNELKPKRFIRSLIASVQTVTSTEAPPQTPKSAGAVGAADSVQVFLPYLFQKLS